MLKNGKKINAKIILLVKNNTWKIKKKKSFNRKSINSKSNFKIKTKANGTIEKYEVKIIARGFIQVQGIDYIETFSYVIKLNSIKVLLASIAQHNLKIY